MSKPFCRTYLRAVTAVLACLVATAACGQGIESELRRFAAAYLGPRPKAVVDLSVQTRQTTWAGGFLVATAVRSSGDNGPSGSKDQLSMLVDTGSRTVVAGAIFPLTPSDGVVNEKTLPQVVEHGLPQVLGELLGARVRVRWPGTPSRPTGVVPLTAEVSTGYGYMKLAVAISADATRLAIGGAWPLDRDPRAVRRERLADAVVQWDPGHENAPLQVVEFSDYQCPACKRAWEELQVVLAQMGDKVRHGLVNFPLVSSHPWSFAAAVAGTCVGELRPDLILVLKDEMYRLQDQITVETIGETVRGFARQYGIAEGAFTSCYMKDAALDTVHRQLGTGWGMGVLATPTYFVNGEMISFADPVAARARLEAILAAGGIPEKAD